MKVAYARTPLPKSIFLAGPTPREEHVKSWRPEAVTILNAQGFDGTVFVPEDSDQSWKFSYDDQIEWELQALHSATAIVFWVPRDQVDMPAFTTNVEFGYFVKQPNVAFGFPDGAFRMKYLRSVARMHNHPTFTTLYDTLVEAIRITNRPFPTT